MWNSSVSMVVLQASACQLSWQARDTDVKISSTCVMNRRRYVARSNSPVRLTRAMTIDQIGIVATVTSARSVGFIRMSPNTCALEALPRNHAAHIRKSRPQCAAGLRHTFS